MHYASFSFRLTLMVAMVTLAAGCGNENSSRQETPKTPLLVKAGEFSADSAYLSIERQLLFGPRVPNSHAHKKCGDYIVGQLEAYDWKVTQQLFSEVAFDGTKLNGRNIIGSYKPDAAKRILLAAHWDSRPFADADSTTRTKPVPAANDGASGVGVLLEIARVIQLHQPDIGVDIIFFDAEDWGGHSTSPGDKYSGFCLGSQYWSKNRHIPGYTAYFGILLDMVGAKGATFPKEGSSMNYAPSVVNNIWETASRLGYDQYFIDTRAMAITDDHLPVNEVAGIPMIDIIHLEINNPKRTFFNEWHTIHDNIENIDKKTLKAVGQTVTQVIFQEAAPSL